jgi:RNA polymerase sigma factor (sigma-70 family)
MREVFMSDRGDGECSAALRYSLDNYPSLLDQCCRAMKARGFLNFESDGEDLVQTVCEQCGLLPDGEWAKVEKRDHYLSAMIRHAADHEYRKKKGSPVINLEDPELHARPHSDSLQAAIELEEALSTLPADRRRLIEMSDLDGLSGRELAELLELTPDNVRKRLSRTRRYLKSILTGTDPGPPPPG